MKVVTLSTIDFGNLSPLFNSYCMAAAIWEERNKKQEDKIFSNSNIELPCHLDKKHTKYLTVYENIHRMHVQTYKRITQSNNPRM